MRSPIDATPRLTTVRGPVLAALMVALLWVGGASAAAPPAPPAPPAPTAPLASPAADAAVSQPITPERVAGVVAELRAGTAPATHSEHRLRWKGHADASAPAAAPPPPWLIGLARWLAQGARGAIWLLGAIAVALVIVFAWRWASVRADAAQARAALRPSHVNDLDIRPESLPADIAASARALRQRGESRAALSLLYRGALSRLVHRHGVAIRAASTEGECVRLARPVLCADGGAYFERLVQAWQTEVYAARSPEAATVYALCDAFDQQIPAPAAPAPDGVPRAAGAGA